MCNIWYVWWYVGTVVKVTKIDKNVIIFKIILKEICYYKIDATAFCRIIKVLTKNLEGTVMGYRKKDSKNQNDIFAQESYRVRSLMSQRKRKNELKARIILFGTGLVLVVVLTILAFKLAGLNKNNNGNGDNVVEAGAPSDNKDETANKEKNEKQEQSDDQKEAVNTVAAKGKKDG